MPTVTDLINLRDNAATAQAAAAAAAARADATASDLARLGQPHAQAVQRNAVAQAALAAAQQASAKIPAAEAAVQQAGQAVAGLDARIAALDAQIAGLRQQIDQLAGRRDLFAQSLLLQIRQLEATRAALDQQRQQAVAAQAAAVARLNVLRAQARQLAAAQIAADAAAAELKRIDDLRARLTREVQAARREAALAGASAAALEAQLENALDQLVTGLRPDVPIVMLPVRIETRFRISPPGAPPTNQLLIRVYPDDVHKDSHELELTDEELQSGKHFWRETWRAGTAGPSDVTYPARHRQELAAWQQLATRFGAARAAYLARRLTPTNASARPTALNLDEDLAVEPQFDTPIPARVASWTRAARARALPDRWLVVGQRTGQPSNTVWGPLIPAIVATGPDPSAPPPTAADRQADVPVDAGMRWMVDFAAAEANGMGIRMSLSAAEAASGFDRLIVLGVKGTLADPKDGAAELRGLLEAHRFTWGCGFVPQGTPTNNTEQVTAGYSREDVGFQRSFVLERDGGEPPLPDDSDGAAAARAFGLDVADLAAWRNADGFDQRNAANFNRVLWPVTFGYFLTQIFNDALPAVDLQAWRQYVVQSVRARGPLPALRIGRQPYGMLPATSLDRWAASGRTDLVALLRSLREVWRASLSKVARAGRSPDVGVDLVETLGLLPISNAYTWRWARGPHFFNSFWRLPGQQVNQADIDAAQASLTARIEAALRQVGLSDSAWTRLTRMTFARTTFDWDGPLVAPGALSDTEGLRHNYLKLLADSSLSLGDVHGESPALAPAGQPKPLLYQLVRHATLLAYAEQALTAWPVARSAPTDAPWFDPELIDIDRNVGGGDRPGDPLKTPTFWRVLQTVLSGAALSLGDDLRQRGMRVPDPLRAFLVSLAGLASVPSAALARLLGEALDLASHRIDAWITSLATSRLSELRATEPTGVYVGGYSWVENLRPRLTAPLSDGFVHAPSIAQATSAAVLRAAYLTHQGQPLGARLAVDLSSRRVRLAKTLLDGVRQGQPLAALLGYRFERTLHDGDPALNRFIAPLRQLAPLAAGKVVPVDPGEPVDAVAADSVVDGLKLLELFKQSAIPFATLNPNPAERDAITAALNEIDDAVDAIGDLALAEGVHQAVQGNYLRAGATLDAISRGETPGDEPQVIVTPRSGVAMTQRLVALFNKKMPAASSWNRTRARASAEPVLTAWAEQLLGSPARVRCQVAYFAPDKDVLAHPPDATGALTMDVLGLSALDVVYAPPSANDAQQTEFEGRLARAALKLRPPGVAADASVRLLFRRQPGVFQADDLTVPDLFELAHVARELFTNARSADARDLARAGIAVDPGVTAPAAELASVLAIWAQAKRALRALFQVSVQADLDRLIAKPFSIPAGVVGTGVNLLDLTSAPNLPVPFDLAAASDALDMPELATLDDLRDGLDAFADFAVQGAVPRSIGARTARARSDLVVQAAGVHAQVMEIDRKLAAITGTGANDALASFALLFGEAFRVLKPFTVDASAALLPALQRRERAADAETVDVASWLLAAARVRDGARRLNHALTYASFLGPGDGMGFQVAQLPFDETDRWNVPAGPAAAGATSLVIHARDDLDVTDVCAGLMIDEWVETIPRETMQTALAFHYDAPGSCAPQVILLVVSPDPTKAWDVATLEAVLTETFELAKLRAVDYDSLSGVGHLLPAAFVAANAGGDPAGDTVSSMLGR